MIRYAMYNTDTVTEVERHAQVTSRDRARAEARLYDVIFTQTQRSTLTKSHLSPTAGHPAYASDSMPHSLVPRRIRK